MVFALLPLLLSLQAPPADVTGDWLGTIRAGAMELRLAFHVVSKDGKLGGTMDSIDQGANGIHLGEVSVEAGTVRMTVPLASGKVEGKLSGDGKEIAGNWTQGVASTPLTLKRVTEMPKALRPQTPKKPYPYNETELSYESLEPGIHLAGTLTIPAMTAPAKRKRFPAVVLITGSGAQDRDETLMEHKPFLVLADYLTRHGIAVLRVDDRGVGGSSGSVSNATSLDFVKDVLAGVAQLRARPEVDPKKIGLIGHSEGALIGPVAASQSKDIAFLVMLAGTGVPGEQIVEEQAALIARAMGASEDSIGVNRELQRRIVNIVRTEPDNTKAKERIAGLAGARQASQFLNPWFRAFLFLDPAVYLRKVTCPVLVLNGELDLQVSPKQNLPAIEKALQEAGNQDFTLKQLPGLNHLFQTAKTGVPAEYARIEETMSPVVLEMITGWINQHTQNKGK